MAKKQKMSAKQKQARLEAAAAREAAAAAAKERKELWKRIGIAVVAILLIAGLMVPTMAVSFCGNQQIEQQAAQQAADEEAAADADNAEGTVVEVTGEATEATDDAEADAEATEDDEAATDAAEDTEAESSNQ